jgi:hypothetical protein
MGTGAAVGWLGLGHGDDERDVDLHAVFRGDVLMGAVNDSTLDEQIELVARVTRMSFERTSVWNPSEGAVLRRYEEDGGPIELDRYDPIWKALVALCQRIEELEGTREEPVDA